MRAVEKPARIGFGQPCGVAAMGSFSWMHWIVVLAIILILFGAGKLPRVMGDFAKCIKAFKAGLEAEQEAAPTPPAQVTAPAPASPSPGPVGLAADSPGSVRSGR